MKSRILFFRLQLSYILISSILLLLLFAYLAVRSTILTPSNPQQFDQDEQLSLIDEDTTVHEGLKTTWIKYENDQGGLTFRYPPDYKVFTNDEVTVKQTDRNLYYQDEFAAVLGYRPPQVVVEVYVSHNSVQPSVHHNPTFHIWVLENSAQLSIDDWYQKYQYYPAVWGQLSDTKMAADIPSSQVEIGSHVASFSASNDYRREQYGYLLQGSRIFLFQVDMQENVSSEILSTFQVIE